MSSPEREAFCKRIKDAAKEENVAVGEYVALALDALKVADLSTLHKQRESISIVLEKIRDDEASHRDVLTKIVALVCPLEPLERKYRKWPEESEKLFEQI